MATPEQERKAVELLGLMLRKCKNNEQVVSVLVQHFAESHAALKSAVLPRAAVGGPRKWFLKVRIVSSQLAKPTCTVSQLWMRAHVGTLCLSRLI
jgi:hypothetical protein